MADDALLVFCPYNYIISPVIRGAMEVDIKGAIIVLDEAQYVPMFYLSLFVLCSPPWFLRSKVIKLKF